MEFEEAAARWLIRRLQRRGAPEEADVDWSVTPKVTFRYSRETPDYSSWTAGDPSICEIRAEVMCQGEPMYLREDLEDDAEIDIPKLIRETTAIAQEDMDV